MRVLLRWHVLQHDRADESDERGRDEHAQKSHGPRRRAEDEIGRRRTVQSTDGCVIRVPVSAVVNRFSMLDRLIIINLPRRSNYAIT